MVTALFLLAAATPVAVEATATPVATYTFDGEFDAGSAINVVHSTPDQLQLDDTVTPFGFIWIAVSSKGTIVKIDTETGQVLGEYMTSPAGQPKDPSRTTVDNNGNVWAGNRAGNSVIHVGLEENGQCVDRNGNGVIDTSTGLNDIRPWSNAGGVDTNGGVTTASDECIIHYVRVAAGGTRHVSVDANNDVWVSGYFAGCQGCFTKIDGDTGAVLVPVQGPVGFGGYGGLIDPNGVIWSAGINNGLLRWNPLNPLSGPSGSNWHGLGTPQSYGLCIGPDGHVWNTVYLSGVIRRYSPAGVLLGTFSHGAPDSQGCAVDANGHVWVAHAHWGHSSVGHLRPDGSFVGNVATPGTVTGISVDGDGKIWATGFHIQKGIRIDPTAGPLVGGTPLGAVDLVTVALGGVLYNYSDMTGSTLTGMPDAGTWTVLHDTGVASFDWGHTAWTADVFGDGALTVTVASSEDGVGFSPTETAANGVDLTVPNGRFLQVTVAFARSTDGQSPILYDLSLFAANEAPDCAAAAPTIGQIWPPNHKFVQVGITGVTDADGDAVTIVVDSIMQDEPTDTTGDGRFAPDGKGVGTATAEVRAERAGTPRAPGDGRVYLIGFTADDGNGGACTGVVSVTVPHDQSGAPAVDSGAIYDSTV